MPPYSGLETTLIALITAIVSCVGLFIAMGKVFMTRRECELHNRAIESADTETCKKIQELLNIQSLQFRMLRTIIVYMDIPQDKKEAILNMKGREADGQ
jgi:uncharacterized membrane protein YozB (DUF420 family)